LGNRNAAGEFIQRGTYSISPDSIQSVYFDTADTGASFPVAFGSTPLVFASNQTQANSFCGVKDVTTTGFGGRGGGGTFSNDTAAYLALGG